MQPPVPASTTCARTGAAAVFNNACVGGLCAYGAQSSHEVQDYSTATSSKQDVADVWWPEAKGGRWNNSAATKPGSGGSCTFTGAVPLGTYTGATRMSMVSRQPEYLIEAIRKGDADVYRVTARGFGARANTEVVMQTYVQP